MQKGMEGCKGFKKKFFFLHQLIEHASICVCVLLLFVLFHCLMKYLQLVHPFKSYSAIKLECVRMGKHDTFGLTRTCLDPEGAVNNAKRFVHKVAKSQNKTEFSAMIDS